MSLTNITTVLLFAIAAGLAWFLGGREGMGVLSGFASGALIAGGSLGLQRKIALERPRFLLHAVFAGFLLKAFAMLGLTLIVAYVPAVSAACDPVTFLLAFAASALLILLPATFDMLKVVTAARSMPVSQHLSENRRAPAESGSL